MADDLDALRRQHREDRLRKRERERQEQRKEGQRRKEIERSRLNTIRSRKRKKEFEKEHQDENDNHCEVLSTSEAARRKRIQRLKEEKKAEDALKMLQKLYPDTMNEVSNVFTNETNMKSSRSKDRLKRQKLEKGKKDNDKTFHSNIVATPTRENNTYSLAGTSHLDLPSTKPEPPSTIKRNHHHLKNTTNNSSTTTKPPLHHGLLKSKRSGSWLITKTPSTRSLDNRSFNHSPMIGEKISIPDSPQRSSSFRDKTPSSTESSKTSESFSTRYSSGSRYKRALFNKGELSFSRRNKNEESSSDEDLLSLAHQIQKKNHKQQNDYSDYHDEMSRASIKSRIALSDSDDDDLLASARKLSQRSCDDTAKLPAVLISTNEKKKIRFSQLSESDNDSQFSQDSIPNKLTQRRFSQTIHKKPRRIPNNPIALKKRMQENRDISMNSHVEKHEQNITDISMNENEVVSKHKSLKEDLWSDSEGEESRTEDYKLKRSKRKFNQNNSHRSKHSNLNTSPLNMDKRKKFPVDYDLNELKPTFSNPKLGAPSKLEPFILRKECNESEYSLYDENSSKEEAPFHEVPASINRYLLDYQREGVQFLYSSIVQNKGAILGDDMGLGKTVQIIALIAALQRKTGTGKDLRQIRERQAYISEALLKSQNQKDQDLMRGILAKSDKSNILFYPQHRYFAPILIIVPPSIISNFSNELNTWGHFAVTVFQGKERMSAIENITNGHDDILIIGKSLLTSDQTIDLLQDIKWKLIVVDEFHDYKNNKSRAYSSLTNVQRHCKCPIIGMTGTLMSNDQKELHVLVDLVRPGLLGDSKSFKKYISIPMKLARTKDAKEDVLNLGKKRRDELDNILRGVYLKRNKEDVLKDSLTEKEETVIICALSDIQKTMYQRVLNLPDYLLLRLSTSPCDCGVNRNFFVGYKKMRTRKEQIEYQRRHKGDLIPRKRCCYRVPFLQSEDKKNPGCIDPTAVLWRISHPDNKECDRCPTCILLPALQKLYKICSHASLIQAGKHPDKVKTGTKEWGKCQNELDFAKVVISPSVLSRLPGKSFVREDSIMDNHLSLSGKMQALDNCLRLFYQNRDRALIFSYSTSTLDLIQHYVRSKGYSFLRLDGSVATKKKQLLVDKFQESNDIFLFLISTKAGGLGLNLTAANKVIIYDVNWNPSHDAQAQDRAFRIGQLKNVDVIRLVARGTIEELMYARQIYKVHLTKETLESTCLEKTSQPARIFRGVDKDPNRKGELFGSENLLKFKDGSFLSEMWKSSDGTSNKKSGSPHETHSVLEVTNALTNMSKEQIEKLGDGDAIERKSSPFLDGSNHENDSKNDHSLNTENTKSLSPIQETSKIGMPCIINHNDFLRSDRGRALLRPGDDGFEEELGGESQMVHVSCAIECQKIDSGSEDSEGILSSRHDKQPFKRKQIPDLDDTTNSDKSLNKKMTTLPNKRDYQPKGSVKNSLLPQRQRELNTIEEMDDHEGMNDEYSGSFKQNPESESKQTLKSIYIPNYLRHTVDHSSWNSEC